MALPETSQRAPFLETETGMKSISEIFPRASKDTIAANPALAVKARTRIGLRRGIMNKIETEYWQILQEQKSRGEILRAEFEGITLRFANVRYTPDFVVIENWYTKEKFPIVIKFIEVKGPFIKGNRERAVERFRHAKTYWPEFTFEMWQKKDGQWTQII